jgi:hypothetical protein
MCRARFRTAAVEAMADGFPKEAQEIGLMLEGNVVLTPEDIDLCMITGAGRPMHLGGITPYLDRLGATWIGWAPHNGSMARHSTPHPERRNRTPCQVFFQLVSPAWARRPETPCG